MEAVLEQKDLIVKTLNFGFTHWNFDLFEVFLTVPTETTPQKKNL